MKSIKILAMLAITATVVSVGPAKAEPPKTTPCDALEYTVQASKQSALITVYTSQLGVRELTGKNDGLQVEAYLKTVGLGKGYAWCAAFVKWCLIRANIPNNLNAMALSAHNKSNLVYYKKRFYKPSQPGDVFTLYYARLGRIGHTGFVDRQINSSIYESVEGNTNEAGSREGDGVYRKKRSYNATYSISRWQ